jgi:hypothetical protein
MSSLKAKNKIGLFLYPSLESREAKAKRSLFPKGRFVGTIDMDFEVDVVVAFVGGLKPRPFPFNRVSDQQFLRAGRLQSHAESC